MRRIRYLVGWLSCRGCSSCSDYPRVSTAAQGISGVRQEKLSSLSMVKTNTQTRRNDLRAIRLNRPKRGAVAVASQCSGQIVRLLVRHRQIRDCLVGVGPRVSARPSTGKAALTAFPASSTSHVTGVGIVPSVGHSPNHGHLVEGRLSCSTTATKLPSLLVWRTSA